MYLYRNDLDNRLANHGYIPRNGKNITIPAMLNAVDSTFFHSIYFKGSILIVRAQIGTEVFNVPPEVISLQAKLAVLCSNQTFGTFDLGDTAL